MTLERLTKITSIGISSGIQITNPVFAGVVTATKFNTENINATGVSTLGNTVVGGGTTQLIVTGDARITGILTIGTSSVTLDGTNNQVNVGTGVTIHHTNGVQVGVNTLHSTGLTINQINVGTGASISSPATNVLTLGTNSTEAIRIGSNGNVGIGTTNNSSSAKLRIFQSQSLALGPAFIVDVGGPNGGYLEWQTDGTAIGDIGSAYQLFGSPRGDGNHFAINARADRPLILGSNNTERVRINSSGSVGIGTTNPTSLLTVKNGTDTGFSNAQIKLGDSTNDVGIQISQASDNVGAPRLVFAKSRGTLNSPTTVQTDDQIFSMRGSGYVGSTGGWASSGFFGLFVDGPVSNTSNGLGTRFSIWTKPNGGSENLERVRVSAAGTMTLRASGGAFIEGYNADDNLLSIAKLSRMGYSTGYRNLIIGKHLPNSTSYTYQSISLNYDPSTNASGNFTGNGNEIFVPNNNQSTVTYTSILQPNTSNDNFNSLVRFGPSGQVLLPSQPAFRVYSPSGAVNTIITFGSTEYNIGSHMNASTGVFTAPIAGRYFFSFAILCGNPMGSYVRICFCKNATTIDTNLGDTLTDGLSTYGSPSMSMIFSLAANDTIRLRVEGSGVYGTNFGSFSGCLIG